MEKTTLKTNGLCFICLERVGSEIGNNFVSMRWTLHYLSISFKKCVQVELCHVCEKINSRLITLFVNLEKIQMEISYYLNQTHERLAKSKSKELTERYSKVMTKDAESLSQLVHVDKLRKELLIKCRSDQHGPQLQAKLIRLASNTKEVAIGKQIAEVNESCEDIEDCLPSSPDSYTDFQPISPTPPSPEGNYCIPEVASVEYPEENGNDDMGPPSPPSLTLQENEYVPSSPDSSLDFQPLSPIPASPVSEEDDILEIVSPLVSSEHLGKLPATKDNLDEQKVKISVVGPRNLRINKKRRNNLKCDLCPLKFESRNELLKHERTHKGKCPICKEVYPTKEEIDQHMSTHKPEEVFQCDICQKYLKSKSALHFHRNIHQPLEKRFPSLLPVKCPICGKTLHTKFALKTHMENVHGQETPSTPDSRKPNFDSQCNICKRILKDPQGLNLHMAKYHTAPEEREAAIKKALSCAICNKTLLTLYGLKVHQRSHNGEKSFLCELCPKSFVQNGILQQHLRRAHYGQVAKRNVRVKPETRHTCPVCDKEFKEKSKLKEHLNGVHRPFVKTSPFQCDTCGDAFTQERSLKSHIFLLHVRNTERQTCTKSNRKYFQCPVCKKMICDSQRNLKMHMRTHTLEKPFKCELCGMAFSVAGTLKYHKICKHSEGSKPYACGLCGKAFIRPYMLDYHRHKVHKVSKEDGSLPSVTPSLFKSHQ